MSPLKQYGLSTNRTQHTYYNKRHTNNESYITTLNSSSAIFYHIPYDTFLYLVMVGGFLRLYKFYQDFVYSIIYVCFHIKMIYEICFEY
jgi:hypothetical protein